MHREVETQKEKVLSCRAPERHPNRVMLDQCTRRMLTVSLKSVTVLVTFENVPR